MPKSRKGQQSFTLRKGERRAQKAFVDTTRIERNKWSLLCSILTGARCARRCMTEWNRRIGESHVQHLAEGSEESGQQEGRGALEPALAAERQGMIWRVVLRREHEGSGHGQNARTKGLVGSMKRRPT